MTLRPHPTSPHYFGRQLISPPDVRLTAALWQWLALGGLVLLLVPGAGGKSTYFGAGGFWLLAAPIASLLILYRYVIAAAWHGILVSLPRHRRPRKLPRQARRVGYGPRPSRTVRRVA